MFLAGWVYHVRPVTRQPSSLAWAEQWKADNEAKRKRMTHHMIDELAALFDILSAKNWEDIEPKMSKFAKKLTDDKDPFKGIQYVTIEAKRKRFSCKISKSCLVQFFS